jgi:hypothetical protein
MTARLASGRRAAGNRGAGAPQAAQRDVGGVADGRNSGWAFTICSSENCFHDSPEVFRFPCRVLSFTRLVKFCARLKQSLSLDRATQSGQRSVVLGHGEPSDIA